MKKKISKELILTRKDDEDFENSTKCGIYGNFYVGDVKVRDHVMLLKHIDFLHIEIVVFHNLKNYDFNLIMQELNLKINIIPN